MKELLNVELSVPQDLTEDEAFDMLKALEHQLGVNHHDEVEEGANWHPVPERAALEKKWVSALDFDWLYNQVAKLFDLPLEKALVSSPYGKWLRPSWERKIDKILKRFFRQPWDVLVEESIRVGIDPRSSLAKRVLPALVEQEMNWVKIFISSFTRKMGADISYGIANDVITAGRHRYPPQRLAYDLRQRFTAKDSVPQRDWRRVAITESNRLAETGVLSTHPDNVYVYFTPYPTACKTCKALVLGKVFRKIQPPDAPTEEELEHCVWVGRSNYGLKRSEWHACVSMHPLCRCPVNVLNPERWWLDAKGHQQPRVGHEQEYQAWIKQQWFNGRTT